jgi:hypothetical protein
MRRGRVENKPFRFAIGQTSGFLVLRSDYLNGFHIVLICYLTISAVNRTCIILFNSRKSCNFLWPITKEVTGAYYYLLLEMAVLAAMVRVVDDELAGRVNQGSVRVGEN